MQDKLDKVDAKAKKNGEDIHSEKEILKTLSTTVQSTKTSLESNIEATESPLLKITDTESLLLNAINSRFDLLWRTWKFDSEHMNADYRTLKTSLAELKTSSDTYCSDIKSIKEKAGELKTQVSTFETALNEKKTRLDSILKQAEKDVTEFQASCKSALETFDTSSKAKLGVSYVIATESRRRSLVYQRKVLPVEMKGHHNVEPGATDEEAGRRPREGKEGVIGGISGCYGSVCSLVA